MGTSEEQVPFVETPVPSKKKGGFATFAKTKVEDQVEE
jgi:hypothetical protein